MKIRTNAILIVIALSAIGIFGQDKAKKPTPPPAAAPAPVAPAPQPTELDRTKLENLQLRMMLLNQEEQSIPERRSQIQQQYGALIREIEAGHPGYAWNPTANALVPKPAPQPAAKPAPMITPAPAEAPKK